LGKISEKKKGGYGKGKKENYKKKGNLRMGRCGLKVRGRHSAEDRPYQIRTNLGGAG
jgi:hypothetical protein